jgi:hypothetical protein
MGKCKTHVKIIPSISKTHGDDDGYVWEHHYPISLVHVKLLRMTYQSLLNFDILNNFFEEAQVLNL